MALSNVALFRIAMGVLVMGIDFLVCLAGKLIKERSAVWYGHYFALCCGVFLALGLSSIFRRSSILNEKLSFLLFTLPVLIFACLQILSTSSAYEYATVRSGHDVDDSELSEVELVERHQESSPQNSPVVSADTDEPSSQAESSNLWHLMILFTLLAMQLATGVLLGSQEHSTFDELRQSLAISGALAMVFGVVCEESLSDPVKYIRSVLYYCAALPAGLLWGSFISAESPVFLAAIGACGSGVIVSASYGYLMPTNLSLSNALLATVPLDSKSAVLRAKSFSFAVGFVTVMLGSFFL